MTNEDKIKEFIEKETPVSFSVEYELLYPSSSLINIAQKMSTWKDEQFTEERKELLGLVKMLPVDETNQTIIEDLIEMLH